jgi:hypothetical protein
MGFERALDPLDVFALLVVPFIDGFHALVETLEDAEMAARGETGPFLRGFNLSEKGLDFLAF